MSRANQRLRTRKDLLDAAARLMRDGRQPSFEEIAEAALVSRATAYRYFPGLDALLLEAALHVETPTPEGLFANDKSTDALARIERLDTALSAMVAANEGPLRAMLAQSLQPGRPRDPEAPVRQNRRTPLIAAALAPAMPPFRSAELNLLSQALVMFMGIEAVVVFKDVLELDDAEAARVRRWAIRALVAAARKG